MPKTYIKEEIGGRTGQYSNGFVLVQHDYESPKGQISGSTGNFQKVEVENIEVTVYNRNEALGKYDGSKKIYTFLDSQTDRVDEFNKVAGDIAKVGDKVKLLEQLEDIEGDKREVRHLNPASGQIFWVKKEMIEKKVITYNIPQEEEVPEMAIPEVFTRLPVAERLGIARTEPEPVTSILSEEIKGRYFNKSETKFRVDNNKLSLHLEECDLTMNMRKAKFKTRNAGNVGLLYLADSETKIRTVGGKTIIDLPTTREIELSGWQESVNKLNKAAARLLDSPSFNAFLGGLQLMCLQSGVENLKSFEEDYGESYFDIAAATAGLTEAAMRVHAGMIRSLDKHVPHMLGRRIRLAGAVAGYLTAGVCVWDGVNAFLERDKDAGVAYISAGMAFGISTTYSTVLAGAAMAGPIALLAAGVAFALLLAAHALTDREIQKFFKYFLLSNARSLPKKQGESPVQYGRRILQNQEYLMGKKPTGQALRQWMNPEHAHLSFYDMIVCTEVNFYDKEGPTSIKIFPTGSSPSTASFTHKYNIVTAELSFQMFFNVESGCKTLAYFFPNGVKEDEWEPAGSDFPWEFVPNDDQFPSLRIKIEIPDDKISRIKSGSELLLLVRVVNTGKDLPSFPLSWGDSRYLAARVELFDINDIRFDKDVKVKIDTRNNLLNPAIWKE